MGYLLIQSGKDGAAGAKERFIKKLLEHFHKVWKIRPIITLTDEDISEINAFAAEFPSAKHQLCFWHCLRAIKTRLSILRRPPKFYDVKEAVGEFDWIDPDFVPAQQAEDPSAVDPIRCQESHTSCQGFISGCSTKYRPRTHSYCSTPDNLPEWMCSGYHPKDSHITYSST